MAANHSVDPRILRLIAAIEAAVALGDAERVTEAVRHALCRAIREGRDALPERVYEPHPERYARRELFRAGEAGFTLIAMTWGPGQGTAIHDHAGLWCVEGVWSGTLQIVPYERTGTRGDEVRLEPRGVIDAVAGSAGSLIPPHEYHLIRNPARDEIAVSLHVYQAPMRRCRIFEPIRGGWHRARERELHLDP
jgi:predicted metal-dependent enzyme (double-stranded beta helix superfamily)